MSDNESNDTIENYEYKPIVVYNLSTPSHLFGTKSIFTTDARILFRLWSINSGVGLRAVIHPILFTPGAGLGNSVCCKLTNRQEGII